MDRLSGLSKDRRKQAEKILLDGNVIPTLIRYGQPEIIGSFALDVMYDPDIDIVVLSKNPQKDSFDALVDFINQRKFQKYEYGDFVKFKRFNRPNGFIVNLHAHSPELRWEIEIWFLKSIKKELELNAFLKKEIDEHKRKKIIGLKHQRAICKKSKYDLDSLTIYRKVIKKSV